MGAHDDDGDHCTQDQQVPKVPGIQRFALAMFKVIDGPVTYFRGRLNLNNLILRLVIASLRHGGSVACSFKNYIHLTFDLPHRSRIYEYIVLLLRSGAKMSVVVLVTGELNLTMIVTIAPLVSGSALL